MIALAMVCSDAAPGGERPIRRDGALFAGDAADSRADAGRSSCKRGDAFWGESGRCSSTVPQWGPVERGPPLPQKANRSDAARGFLEGTGRTQAEASSREPDRRRSTRLAKRRVTLRCGRDGRLAAGGSQASAGSSGAPAGTSAGARACGPSAGPAGAPPGRRSARHGGHAGSGPKRPSSGLRERCRARGWRLTLATEQRCRGAIRRGRDHGLDVFEPRRPAGGVARGGVRRDARPSTSGSGRRLAIRPRSTSLWSGSRRRASLPVTRTFARSFRSAPASTVCSPSPACRTCRSRAWSTPRSPGP